MSAVVEDPVVLDPLLWRLLLAVERSHCTRFEDTVVVVPVGGNDCLCSGGVDPSRYCMSWREGVCGIQLLMPVTGRMHITYLLPSFSARTLTRPLVSLKRHGISIALCHYQVPRLYTLRPYVSCSTSGRGPLGQGLAAPLSGGLAYHVGGYV